MVEYGKDEQGMFYLGKKNEKVYLSNFTAEIVQVISKENESREPLRYYEIEVRSTQFESQRFIVPALRFNSCYWIDQYVSTKAYLLAGRSKQHFVNAIRACSNPPGAT
jgi:hypothetical protein